MERLLKIVEGPMRGAEIALVAGTRIKVGRGDDCDIVVADASLPETAFELDVADAAVTMVLPDGTAREMRPFEIHAFGTTSVALGPAEGAWEELRPAERETPPESPVETPAEPETPVESAPAEVKDEKKKKSGLGCGIGCLGVILLILIVLALAWFFRSPLVERVPQLKPVVERIESFVSERTSTGKTPSAQQPKRPVTLTLRELAAQHGISYAERESRPVLSGNLAHRTERLAIRALALATDRHCGLELSDDETLAGSADALLFTVTEGALKVFAVSNRAVTITGYAPSSAALDAALKALRADVPWTGDVDIRTVKVGGPVPEEHKTSAFAVSGTLSDARPKAVAETGAKTAAETDAKPAAEADAKPVAETRADVADIKISDVNGRRLPQNMFPVAGVLTRPYPCVVLRDGHRIVEGGQLGSYTVVRIEADAVELKQGGGKANWKP